MTIRIFNRATLTFIAGCAMLFAAIAGSAAASSTQPGVPPNGFTSADAKVNGSKMHYVRGGHGPAVILIHGFPEDWAEYQVIMPRLAKRFTVVSVDLPGIGHSAAPAGGYEVGNLAAQIHGLAEALHLKRPYVVGHDLGGIAAYGYLRRFPDSLRGAMIFDAPLPGLAGAEESGKGLWHVGFIQVPDLAEVLVPGRQSAFLGWFLDLGKFTPQERRYYARAYRKRQLHAAFEIYRALPRDAEWNAAQTAPNSVPLVVGVGAKSLFSGLLTTFAEGYRAKGMTDVESVLIPDAGHYVITDNPDAVADLIEKHAGSDAP